MTTRPERILIGGGILVVVGLIGLTAYLGYQQIANARAEEIAAATRVAGLAPTWTAAAQLRATSTPPPATAQSTSVPPTSVPATAVTPRPASPTVPPTPVPATKPVAGATPTAEGRYLGRDPLPPGIDLTNGPVLKELKARGAKGVNVGDGGLGDELKAAYEAALQVERQSLDTNDDGQLRQYFTGEALERLLRLVARGKADTGKYTTVGVYEPRIMQFMPETTVPGVYEVVDARTQTIHTVERLPDGKPGKIVKEGQPERVCYSVQMVKEGGRWKVQTEDVETGGVSGGRCPPYWS